MNNKRHRVLLLENIHPTARDLLATSGLEVQHEASAWSEEDLIHKLKPYSFLGIRSKTQITAPVLEANPQLLSVGAFCIGTNQIDLSKANAKGIPVFNAPYSNTRSVAELVLAEIIALSRHLGDVNTLAHQGRWQKSASGAHEVRGKTLGIIGYGHIGSQLSILAESLGLRVIYYDVIKKLPLGNAQPCSHLHELLTSSDFISLHVPETPLTHEMIAQAELRLMRPGSYLINASRGTVVKIDDLAEALKSGHLAGAALDVFPDEPAHNQEPFSSPLQGLKNVILTPHIGGSTEEAQEAIGAEVAQSLTKFFHLGATSGAVNFPHVDPPYLGTFQRVLNVHKNTPGVLGEINQVISQLGGNIRAQYLSTDENIGYVVMDIDGLIGDELCAKLSEKPNILRSRLIEAK